MAYTTAQAKSFIDQIAPTMQKTASERGYKIVSAAIAQAICESAAGTSSLWYKYNNAFGMKCGSKWKGKSVNLKTKEEYTAGTLTSISANFRVYDTPEQGLIGYYDFISASRYANLKDATSAQDYLEKIKADGYATSSTYVKTNMTIVSKYNLEQYDYGYVAPTPVEYYEKFVPTLDQLLRAIGVDAKYIGNYKNRAPIAAANGISNYKGTEAQNKALIDKIYNGKLVKV